MNYPHSEILTNDNIMPGMMGGRDRRIRSSRLASATSSCTRQKFEASLSYETLLKTNKYTRKDKKTDLWKHKGLGSRQQFTSRQHFIGFSQQWNLLLGGLHCDGSGIPLVVSDMLFNKAHIMSPSKWWGFSIWAGRWVFLNWFSSSRKPWSPERIVKGICLGSCSSSRPA